MCFKRERTISTLRGMSLKLVDKFPYLSSTISSTESDVNTREGTDCYRRVILYGSDLIDKIKRDFFQAMAVSLDPVGEVRANSLVTFFYGPLHLYVSVLDDQQELTYISPVLTLGISARNDG